MIYAFLSAEGQKRFLVHEVQAGVHNGGEDADLDAQMSMLHNIQKSEDFLDNQILKSLPQSPQERISDKGTGESSN